MFADVMCRRPSAADKVAPAWTLSPTNPDLRGRSSYSCNATLRWMHMGNSISNTRLITC